MLALMSFKNINQSDSYEEKEAQIKKIAEEYIKKGEYDGLFEDITNLNEYLPDISNARLTKLIKQVYGLLRISYQNYEQILNFLEKLIYWAQDKKILKIDLQCNLIYTYLKIGKYSECLDKIKEVSKDLKKYDDKNNLIDLYIYESKAYYELKDFSRARASLTSARALSVSSACPYGQQAEIDLLNGMYLSDDHAYSTASSYFIESLEGFIQDNNINKARLALRYILVCNIMARYYKSRASEKYSNTSITSILNSKYAVKIKDDEYIQLLILINDICNKRDLRHYNEILINNKMLIEADHYIYKHMCDLYDILLQENILKIIEPYSHVKINFIAEKLGFDEVLIENKLGKMILDGTINGVLDHVSRCLILNNEKNDETHQNLLKNIFILKDYLSKLVN